MLFKNSQKKPTSSFSNEMQLAVYDCDPAVSQ